MSTLVVRLSVMKKSLFSLKSLGWLCLLSFPAMLLYGFFYSEHLIFYVIQAQQKMHRELATLLQQVKQNPGEFGPALMLASFLYGIFHAAGPGHGKAIIATYMGTQIASLKKGVQFSFMAAFLQAAVAVALVTALVRLLELSMRQSQWIGSQFEAMSYLLVVMMGALLSLKQLRRIRKSRAVVDSATVKPVQQAGDVTDKRARLSAVSAISATVKQKDSLKRDGTHPSGEVKLKAASLSASSIQLKPVQTPEASSGALKGAGVLTSHHQLQPDGSCSCGHKHLPMPEELKTQNWKESAGIILSMGLRPCTGALLVLMLANALGLYWYGVLSSLLMALGTAITVSFIAFLSVSVRRYAGRLMKVYQATGHNGHWINLLGLAGGLMLIVLGSGLFWSFLQMSNQSRPF